jgi:hypothetical protein
MDKVHKEIEFVQFMKSCSISKRKQKENRQLCDEFPSFLYDMINDQIHNYIIYEFIYINYKRNNFYKQLYYSDPTKQHWGTPLSLAIYKQKYTLVSLLIIFYNKDYMNELLKLLHIIIDEVKNDNAQIKKTTVLAYLRIYNDILFYIKPEYLNERYTNGKYLVIETIELKNPEYFNKLIEKGNIDVEVKYKGMTPLMWAIIRENTDCIRRLLEQGANLFAIANTEIVKPPFLYKYDFHILDDIQLPLTYSLPRIRAPRNLNCIEIAEEYYAHLTKYNCIYDEKDEIFTILKLLGISYKIPNYSCDICYRGYLSNKYKFSSCSHDCCYDCATMMQKKYLNEDDHYDVYNDLIIECPFCRVKSNVNDYPLYIQIYICDLNGNHTGKTLEVIPCITQLKDIVSMIYQDDTPFTLNGIRYYVIKRELIRVNKNINIYDWMPNIWLRRNINDIGITNGSRILVSTEMYNYSTQIKKNKHKWRINNSGERIIF